MRKLVAASLSVATLLVAGGYYTLFDALDVVPGFVTAASVDISPRAFPTASGITPAASNVTALNTNAPIPETSQVQSLITSLTSNPAMSGGTVGVVVKDSLTGKDIASTNANSAMVPASSHKVLTAAAALSALGASHRVQTSTYLEGSTLTLVGGGDVLLAADKGDANSVVGHAGLGDLARSTAAALKAKGVTSVNVTLDDTLFTGATWHPSWDSEYSSWATQVQPLMIDVTSHYGGPYPADPAMEATTVFITHLKNAGIGVLGQPTRAQRGANFAKVSAVDSATLAEILGVSLTTSDNTMTEVEGRLVAVAGGQTADFTGATKAVLAQLKKDGYDISGVTMDDCSGLSVKNQVSPNLLATIMTRAAGKDGVGNGRTLLSDLPVSAYSGTLKNRFHNTSAAGWVRAKTGSLSGVRSLTGTIVTASGRELSFSVVLNNIPDGQEATALAAVDDALITPLRNL